MSGKIKIAIPVGDPVGIGPEIALKAALNPAVRAACEPILVCDPDLLARHAKACGINASQVKLLTCPQPDAASLGFGVVSPISGRASIAFCAAAVKAAMTGEVDAVVAAPQHETSIAQAGIKFDGHPSFVARRDRHRRGRRLYDVVLRRHADCPLHPAPERARGHCADHA